MRHCLPKDDLTHMILWVAAVQLLALGSAAAFCFQPNPKVCAEFFRNDAVLTGTVLAEYKVVGEDDSIYGWTYRLRVKRVYRGHAGDEIEVFTENDSGRLPLEVGETYLLFPRTIDGRLTIGYCGNSAKLTEAGDALRQLDDLTKRLKSATGGEVSGVVSESPASWMESWEWL